LRARMLPAAGIGEIQGRKVVAFAGIGRPEKFFQTLRAVGAVVVVARSFADHHRYRVAELAGLRAAAAREGAVLVTTEKDFVRLPAASRAGIVALGVQLVWEDAAAIEALLAAAVP